MPRSPRPLRHGLVALLAGLVLALGLAAAPAGAATTSHWTGTAHTQAGTRAMSLVRVDDDVYNLHVHGHVILHRAAVTNHRFTVTGGAGGTYYVQGLFVSPTALVGHYSYTQDGRHHVVHFLLHRR